MATYCTIAYGVSPYIPTLFLSLSMCVWGGCVGVCVLLSKGWTNKLQAVCFTLLTQHEYICELN